MKPHKHADYVQAFIEGKPVQCRFGSPDGGWFDVTTLSQFDCYEDFRIKPKEKVVRWLWVYCADPNDGWRLAVRYMTKAEAKEWFKNTSHKKLEWSREEFDE